MRAVVIVALLVGGVAGAVVIALIAAGHLGLSDRLPLSLRSWKTVATIQGMGVGSIVIGAATGVYAMWLGRPKIEATESVCREEEQGDGHQG